MKTRKSQIQYRKLSQSLVTSAPTKIQFSNSSAICATRPTGNPTGLSKGTIFEGT